MTTTIEALDKEGEVVPINRDGRGITLGKENFIEVSQEALTCDLVASAGGEQVTHEVVVLDFYDVADHNFVSFDASVARVEPRASLLQERVEPGNPIKVARLLVGKPVTVFVRDDVADLQPALSGVHAFRFTRTG